MSVCKKKKSVSVFSLQSGVVFGRVDCESEQEIAQRFHITKYPTLKMWRNAQVKHYCYNYFYDCML